MIDLIVTHQIINIIALQLENKAIRDGKYIAQPHASVHPIKIENFDIFRDVISLLAQVYIFLIDRATQEVPMRNI